MKIKIYSFICDTDGGLNSYLHASVESLVDDICGTLESYVTGCGDRLRAAGYNTPEWGELWYEIMNVCGQDGDYFSVDEQEVGVPAPALTTRSQRICEIARFEVDDLDVGVAVRFDDSPVIVEGEYNGAYVQAWVWAPFYGTDLDKEVPGE